MRPSRPVANSTVNYNHISTFISPIQTFSLAGIITVYTLTRGTKWEKVLKKSITKGKCRLWWETKNFPFISLLIGRNISIIRRKMYGPDPSEMDIKVLIRAPT